MTFSSPDAPGNDKPDGAVGFGAILRAGREARGLDALHVADALRLSPRMVEAIEAEDLEQLPPPLFVKGYLRSYAALVEIDEGAVLQDFERRIPDRQAAQPLPPHRRQAIDLNDVKRGRQLASVILVLVLLGGATFWWMQPASDVDIGDSSGQTDTAFGPVESPDGSPAVDSSLDSLEPSSGESAASAIDSALDSPTSVTAPDGPQNEPPSALEATRPTPIPPADPVPLTAPAELAPAFEADASTAVLKLRYQDDCWTEVRDARGRQLVYRLAKAGSEQEVSGRPPFSVYLGYAPGVSVEVDGMPVAMSAIVGNSTVARFKLDRPQ